MLRNRAHRPEICLPGRILAGARESIEISFPAGRMPAGIPFSIFSRQQCGPIPARSSDFLPGSIIAQHKVTKSVPWDPFHSLSQWSSCFFSNGSRGLLHKYCNLEKDCWAGAQTIYFVLRNRAHGPEIGLPGRILAGVLPRNHRN